MNRRITPMPGMAPPPDDSPLSAEDESLLGKLDPMAARHISWREPWEITAPERKRKTATPAELKPGRWEMWWLRFSPRRPTLPRDLVEHIGHDTALAAMTANYALRYGTPSLQPKPQRGWTRSLKIATFGVVGALVALLAPMLIYDGALGSALVFLLVMLPWGVAAYAEPRGRALFFNLVLPIVAMTLIVVTLPHLASESGRSIIRFFLFALMIYLFLGPLNPKGFGVTIGNYTLFPTQKRQLERALEHWANATGREVSESSRREFVEALEGFRRCVDPRQAALDRFASAELAKSSPGAASAAGSRQ